MGCGDSLVVMQRFYFMLLVESWASRLPWFPTSVQWNRSRSLKVLDHHTSWAFKKFFFGFETYFHAALLMSCFIYLFNFVPPADGRKGRFHWLQIEPVSRQGGFSCFKTWLTRMS